MFFLIYTLIIIFVFGAIYIWPGYLYKLANRQSLKPPAIYSTIWRITNYVALLLSFIAVYINTSYNMDFRGLWTSRIFIITFLFTVVLHYPIFGNPKRIIPKIYFKGFSFLPLFTALFMYVPFLGPVLVLSLAGVLISPADKILYEDSKVRIETKFKGELGPSWTEGVKKKGFFEETLFSQSYDQDSVSVKETNDSIYVHLRHNWRGCDTTYSYKY